MVDNKTTYHLYAEAIVAENIQAFLRHAQAFSRYHYPEDLHRARVFLRRINNLSALFHDAWSLRDLKRWRRVIGDTAKALGKSRDLDVWIDFLERQWPKVAKAHCVRAREIIVSLKKERSRLLPLAQRAFTRLMKMKIMERMVVGFDLKKPFSSQDPVLVAAGQKKVIRRLKHFLSMQTCLRSSHDGQKLHQMRRKAKKLRYTLEAFEKVFGLRIRYFYTRVYAMQTALGELHDAEMLVDFLRTMRQKKSDLGAQETIDYLIDMFTKKRLAAYKKCLTLLRRSAKEHCWKKLRNFLKRSR